MARILLFYPILLILYGCATTAIPTSAFTNTDLNTRILFYDHKDNAYSPPPHLKTEDLSAKQSVGLEDLLQIADQYNPEIGAARDEVGAASGRLWQTELYPNPTLELEAENIPADDIRLNQSQSNISISQPIILGGRRSAAIRAASADKEGQLFRLEQKRREVFRDVHALFIKLLYLRQAEALYQQLIADAQEILNIAEHRYEAKAVPEVEVLKPEVEIENLRLDFRRLAWERNSVAQRLESLLGGINIPLERISEELPADLPEIEPTQLFHSLKEHPELLAAKKDMEAAEERVNEARAERFPDVSFRLGLGRNAVEGEYLIEGGISMPLPLFDRNQGKIKEAESLVQKSEKTVAAAENKLRADLAAAHAEYLSARDRVAISRDKILPAAEKALSQTQEGYRVGKRNLLDLLDAQRTLAAARLSYIEGLREWNLADAEIRSIAGFQFHEAPNVETEGLEE